MGLTLRVTDGLTLVKVVTLSSSLITWQTRKKQKKRKSDAVRWPEEEERKEQKIKKRFQSTHKESSCTFQQISRYTRSLTREYFFKLVSVKAMETFGGIH